MNYFETDVLVIGGGGAGVMAAYESSKHGGSITIVSKGLPQRSGATVMAPGAISGVGDWGVPGDSRDLHFADTIKGGSFLNDQNLVRILVEESPELILELEQIGAIWQREEDETTYSLRIDGGHSFPRCPFLEDRTGREMLRTLFGEVAKRNVRILPNVMILKIITSHGKVSGAVGLNLETCETVLFKAKAVILACGGAGNSYQNTSNPEGVTGDGFALALDSGAALMDMEFVQFYPVGFLYPNSLRGALGGLLYYSRLRNAQGERFMAKYDPERLELSTRDRVARAIQTEIQEGRGGSHGGVFLDMTFQEPGYIAKMQPTLYETYLKIGVDPEKDYLEIAPTCHFFMGGVKVDENWQSSISGLFAVGENAAGIHGANRLSQNALAELLVSGARAGRAASRYAKKEGQSPVSPNELKSIEEMVGALFNCEEGVRPAVFRSKLRQLMWERVGLFRTEHGLLEALEELKLFESELGNQTIVLKSKRYNRELVEGLENYFLVKAAKTVAQAALLRRESRGAHYRVDFPFQDDPKGLKNLVISQVGDSLHIEKYPVNLEELKPEGGIE